MAKFFKSVGRGILYILFVPFIIVVIGVAALAGIGIFFYQLIKNTILFFQGKSVLKDLEEDKQARAILDVNKELSKTLLANQLNAQTGQAQPQQNTTTTTNNIFIVGSNPEDIAKLMNSSDQINVDDLNVIEQKEEVPQIENKPSPLLGNVDDIEFEDIVPEVEEENKETAIVEQEEVVDIPTKKEEIKVKQVPPTNGFVDEDEEIDSSDSGVSIRSK